MLIKLSPTSQYFSTTWKVFLNFNLLEHSWDASILFSIIITIANPLPLSDSRRFFNQAFLINHWDIVFYFMPVEDSILRDNSSIFPSSKYFPSAILCILGYYQCSRLSITITDLSIDLAALISMFVCFQTRSSILDFFICNTEIAPDWAYLICKNCIYAKISVF